MTKEELIFRKYISEEDSTKEIAKLIYTVDEETFINIFKTENKAISAIEKRFIVSNTIINLNKSMNEEYFVLKNIEGKIIGLILIVNGKKESILSEFIFYIKHLSIVEALKFIHISLMDKLVLSDFGLGDLYLAELAVDKKEQNKGYGKFLLSKTKEIAKNDGFSKVILDVDVRKEKAKKIYEKSGFKVFNKKMDKIFNKKRGMYNMEYIVE
ncbi:GNAT family N-acetyltransferase [Methanobrevibacter curvatus]|uniref:Acetyltransferase (GNAT) family protein n=1 Tax=Methanobrevibacter curvatus TaxID=49547 RepID=A0A166AJG4_9EURY|nr:GNAT family N-acetyltransferase [Methanobrevibacter curvatus]KZX12109.1 acetyltransferase (GNAT) family protein [Methanobrevibacter curvatus]